MNSISFSPLPTFIQKHGSKSKSHRILSLRQNFLAPKFYQCNTSKCKIQPKYSKPLLVAARGGNAAQEPPSPLQDLVHKFYTYINSKDVRRLEKLFDSACVIEDEAYYQPLEGQKVHKFFEKLTQAMGQNVVFAIDDICEGDESRIAVTWHLEWNGESIPFTKGCSLYTCSEYGGTFRIRRANVFMESPFKPGDLALEMLKIIIALFDRFPKLARSTYPFTFGFLRKPAKLVFYVVNLYKFIVEPLMRPVIAYYTLMLAYAMKILTTVVTIIYSMLKLFF